LRNWVTATALLLVAILCAPVAAPAAQKKSKQQQIESQCLLYGTVFTDQGFALPGADVKVRRTTEKKAKWQAPSDRRGEFAIRVPGGEEYEIAIKAKGFEPMTRTVKALAGEQQNLVFRLRHSAGEKKK
jgi:carboxypeptidase family protein